MPSRLCNICGRSFNSGLYTRERVGMRKVHAIDKCLDECYAQVERARTRLTEARAHARKVGYRGPSYR